MDWAGRHQPACINQQAPTRNQHGPVAHVRARGPARAQAQEGMHATRKLSTQALVAFPLHDVAWTASPQVVYVPDLHDLMDKHDPRIDQIAVSIY